MKKKQKNQDNQMLDVAKIRLPKKENREMFAYVVSKLGGPRMLCFCDDGKERICRVPGRLRKYVWVREGDYVIVQLWEIEGDRKGDIVWRYKPLEVEWLKKKGYLKELEA